MKNIAKLGLAATFVVSSMAAALPALAATHHRAMAAPKGMQMAQVKVVSPQQGDKIPGSGYTVEIQITIPAAYAKKIPATSAFVPPTSPYFKAGASHFFPGLVVTDTGTVAKVGGASKNLAGLFQIIGVRWNLAGSEVINADWYVVKPLFSNLAMPCIRAYVVSGTAPSSVAANPTNMNIGTAFHGMTLVSNVAKTDVYTNSGMATMSGM
ncbi:hypothetical protein [Ferroacidibacillus organovorans]|uniref:Uncharacterized protein n=1 Tax=Ferroacidibacillus organovorans TaxID=1765683 RepID=A0A162S9G0_9BACL|nr:hypothetical protein [Ferroacidibacillus organovorans]KYP79632.1 hypothetical protein AYJ22_03465 [Ferroacidibacillus organovorans]OAG94855.1 hypothetical protein AYW79_03630 [Ferroacidibacillus organovorans]OPG16999.1 hypothetical protein B2M26_03615 [Ferroacidibacillus organovorans]